MRQRQEEEFNTWFNRLSLDYTLYEEDMPVIYLFNEQNYFLSNYFPVQLEYDGLIYKTSEHAYQAAKCQHHDQTFAEIVSADTPGQAKRLGQKCSMREDWDEVKFDIMERIVRAKFEQNHSLALDLMQTQGKYLVEGTFWHDNCWGICILKGCPVCRGKIGLNKLGTILMKVRDELVGNAEWM